MKTIKHLIKALAVVNRFVSESGVFIASLFIGIMTVVVITGVFFRYVLNDSITWVEDVSLILMVTTAFIIAPYAVRNSGNVAIEFFINLFPTTLERYFRLIIYSLVLWIIYRYFFESLVLVDRGWSIRVNTLPFQWAWCYMVIPVVFVALASAVIETMLRDIHGLIAGNNEMDLIVDEANSSPEVTQE